MVLVSSQRIDRKPDATARPMPQVVPQVVPQIVPQTPQPGPILPVRPRRVSSGPAQTAAALADPAIATNAIENVFIDPAKPSFQAFADSVGASSLHDLIEAAGAYCTLVLGRDSFTRPQLFQQIESLPGQSDLSREAALRGFGRLLRDGKVTKTRGGQYVLAETSAILTEARRRAS